MLDNEYLNPKLKQKMIIKLALVITICLALIIFLALYFHSSNSNSSNSTNVSNKIEKGGKEIDLILNYEDKIKKDTAWVGTMNLVWQDIFNKGYKLNYPSDKKAVESLNSTAFNKSMLNQNTYYINNGEMTPSFKKQIEDDIKEKFNETSDILDSLEFKEKSTDILFYAMLKKIFKFKYVFDSFDNGEFKFKNKDAKFFGFDPESEEKESKEYQVNLLWYKNKDDFAFELLTNDEDEIYLYKNPEGKSFKEIFENMEKKKKEFRQKNKSTYYIRKLAVPKLEIDLKKSFDNLKGTIFLNEKTDIPCEITRAVETLKFKLNEEGGEVKSEASFVIMPSTAMPEQRDEKIVDLILDTDYALFLKEYDKDIPYLALYISDLDKFQ